jgi:hypothetical protein
VISRDRVAALVLLLAGLGGTLEAGKLTIGDPGHPGPGFFPFWLALALSAVAVVLLVRRVPAGATPAAEPAGRLQPSKVVMALVAGGTYAAALEPLGFVLATFGFQLFLLTVVERRRWASSLAIAAATALACHLLFKVWLGVQLPAGPGGF